MIRPGEPRDEDALARMRQALWTDEPPEESRAEARAFLTGKAPGWLPTEVLVAEIDGEVVGFVEVSLRSFADGCDPSWPAGYLEGWWVDPEARGRGVGGALVAAAEEWCRERGCREMGSDTWLDNDGSRRAHAALGFEVVDHCVNFRKDLDPPATVDGDHFGVDHADGDHYGVDLAALHDAHFGDVARDAAADLLRRLSAAGFDQGLVVDLAAGSGILSRAMVDAGFTAHGVDISAAMLRLARFAVPEATLVHDSLWKADLPDGVVAVAAVGEAFSYATDPTAGLEALCRRLASIHRALVPGGLLLFDVAGPGRSGPEGVRERVLHRDGTYIHVDEREDCREGSLTRDITLLLPFGRLYRRVDERHRLRLFEPGAIGELLSETGFVWERLSRYDATELPPGWFAFVAARPR